MQIVIAERKAYLIGDTSAHAAYYNDTAWKTEPFHLSTSSLRSVQNTIDVDINKLSYIYHHRSSEKKKSERNLNKTHLLKFISRIIQTLCTSQNPRVRNTNV